MTLPSPMPHIYSSLQVKIFFLNQTEFLDADNNSLKELRPCDTTFSNAFHLFFIESKVIFFYKSNSVFGC